MKIPIIINNYNLLTWPRNMINTMKTWDDVGDIIIVDNASDYKPLLDWYETNPCTVIRLKSNIGHKAPWDSGVVDSLKSNFYAVTDPDLDLSNTSKRILKKCVSALNKFSGSGKAGLRLEYNDVPKSSPYYNHVQSYEKIRQIKTRRIDNILLDVGIDTTFAVYNTQKYFIGGITLTDSARHIPWYYSESERDADVEFSQYIKSATDSCSYKTFLRL
jgi:hypothetical protein